MHGFEIIALIGVGIVGTAVLLAPFFLSWPMQVRWTVTQSLCPGAGMPACPPPLDLREVRLERVAAASDGIVVTVLEVGHRPGDALIFERDPLPTPNSHLCSRTGVPCGSACSWPSTHTVSRPSVARQRR